VAPVIAIASVLPTVAGKAPTAARYQRRLARRLVGLPSSEPLNRPSSPKAIGVAFIVLAVGLACWLLLWQWMYAILAVPVIVNFLGVALAGRAPFIGRYMRRLAQRLAPRRADGSAARVVVHAVLHVSDGSSVVRQGPGYIGALDEMQSGRVVADGA
jgi:hypothetical protein